jgi:hypothetical protein
MKRKWSDRKDQFERSDGTGSLSARDLALPLDPSKDQPLYLQIGRALSERIRGGEELGGWLQ